MGRRTIYISEEDMVAVILECCPLAARVFENYFGQDFLRRDDLDKLSLCSAVGLHRQQLHPIRLELNRICM